MHMTNSMYAADPHARTRLSPFSREAYLSYREKLQARQEQRVEPREDEARAVLEVIREQLGGTVNIASALGQFASAWAGRGDGLAVPWHRVPHTSFGARVTGARRFVAQSWPFARVRAVGKALDATLNDTVLAMCAGALRRQLQAQGDVPKEPLKAMAPVSLRTSGDLDSANAVGFLTANLATNEADPQRRLQLIKASMDAGKAQLAGMSKREVELYTLITQAPLAIATLTGLASKWPAFSTIISNVPGPRERLYWNGARLDGLYPVSVPFDGITLNITLVSNHDHLDFGIVACRRSVPHVQRLIDYMEDALVELEEVAGLSPPVGGQAASRGRAAKTASKTGAVKRPRAKSGANARAKTKARAGTKPKANTKAKARTKATRKATPKAKARPKARA
jgi:diacylglycerol O-acyltransferase